MAWRILASCFTLFGVLVLAVSSVRMDEPLGGGAFNEGTGPGSSPIGSESQRPADWTAQPETQKIAA